jgi:hypothetical protein
VEAGMNVVFVMGMPRSGTSMIAGLLAQHGWAAGKNMQQGNVGNTKGYWENRSIRSINHQVLSRMGGHPNGMSRMPEWTTEPKVARFVQEAVTRVLAQEGMKEPWMFKDPKLSLVWPQWLHAFPDATVVITRRNFRDALKSAGKFFAKQKYKSLGSIMGTYFERLNELIFLGQLEMSTNTVYVVDTDEMIAGRINSKFKEAFRLEDAKIATWVDPQMWSTRGERP